MSTSGDLVVADYGDHAGLERLARGAGVVTFEFENVPVEAAAHLRTVPGPPALEQGQDRLREKELFRALGIATARFGSLEEAGLPALVKSRRLGYDGKGQRRVGAPEPLIGAWSSRRSSSPSTGSSRSSASGAADGDTRFWPVGENVHRDGILRVTRVPAAGAPQREAEAICTALMDALDYVGVLAVELFEVGGRLLANEFAPRVHNTAHWTIDGAATSQFENHLRAILGLPLGSTDARAPCVMVNLIGSVPPLGELLELPRAHVHLYGKDAARGAQGRPRDPRRPRRGDDRARRRARGIRLAGCSP